jgi:hypothetical protein
VKVLHPDDFFFKYYEACLDAVKREFRDTDTIGYSEAAPQL